MGKTSITATDFYQYQKCPRIVYLNKHGDPSQKIPRSEFMHKKMQDGIDHEKQVINNYDVEEVTFTTLKEGAQKTIELMKEGVEYIYQGVLILNNKIGKPDLLQKVKGKSKLGDYHYIAQDIKGGKYLKKEYKLQLMFYSELLSNVQGVFPDVATVINSEQKNLEFSTHKEHENYNLVKNKINNVLEGHEESPSLFSFCKECEWQNNCLPKMKTEKDLSLVFKLSRKNKEQLNTIGITTLQELSRASSSDLTSIKGVGETTAKKWILQAQSLVEEKPIIIQKPNLPISATEIFFDIEGETELNIDYLYGCLVREHNKTSFKYFWANIPEDEHKMWKGFIEFFESLENPVIYHYSSYEKTSIKRLFLRYGCNEQTYQKLLDSLVDLLPILQQSVVLPLSFYSIKPVAKYLGFSWRDQKAGGAQSLFWYANYLKGETNLKQTIVEYNEDDVKATLILKDWLTGLNS